MAERTDGIKGKFSVALGLTDYVNPILYTITSATIVTHIGEVMQLPWSAIYVAGAAVSIVCGFAIPTVKLLVGLGKIPFSLPVSLVLCVNSGIFASGLMLARATFGLGTLPFLGIVAATGVVLALIYRQTGKFNNVAVLVGFVGYLLIYASLITRSIQAGRALPVALFAVAICLFLMLVGIGLKADLKNARVHWVIEISNIVCQALVAAGTVILFA